MDSKIPSRDEAIALLHEFNENESLRRHAYAVEAVMRHMARKRGEDEETWGIVGLIHDLDYGLFPEEHCRKTGEILKARMWPEPLIRAVRSHGWGICSDLEPKTDLEKTLFAVDELTGLVAASALVRPSKSLKDLTVKSVMKKWKSPAFAAGVDRSIIEQGAAMLGMNIPALVDDVIMGMRQVADEIGLAGES
ncbi:MAG: HD domain-containing protein [Deltaproteobacteria bacterium]|nr:HD domain-containing protein [Deltaproteobacteria bacterium]